MNMFIYMNMFMYMYMNTCMYIYMHIHHGSAETQDPAGVSRRRDSRVYVCVPVCVCVELSVCMCVTVCDGFVISWHTWDMYEWSKQRVWVREQRRDCRGRDTCRPSMIYICTLTHHSQRKPDDHAYICLDMSRVAEYKIRMLVLKQILHNRVALSHKSLCDNALHTQTKTERQD